MSLQDLAPINSQRAKQTAINTLTRYLSSEGVTMGFIASVLLGDTDGSVFVKLMDRFAVYLAFLEGRDRKYLAKNSIMSYYRHVKNWLLDSNPKHRHVIEKKLLKMAQTLEKHCMRRQDGGPTKKAPACTKRDLKILVDGIYYDASSEKDYQDAALLTLMWFAFGRASDLAIVTKSSLSVTADGVVFIRLIRVKTAEEQGLSLYPDKDCFITCPLHALGIALAMQYSPTSQLLQHPETSLDNDDVSFAATEIPLAEALMNCSDIIPSTSAPEKKTRKKDESMKMHGFVNRIVKSASKSQARAKPTENLSSHSFRRGGAQHANGDPSLSAQWIFDRGSWNMTATNKAFAYVFNTATEDKKVSKVLSGWKSNEKPFVATFSTFDSATQHEMHKLCNLLFASSLESTAVDMRLDVKVAEVLTATMIQHFPEVLERYPTCLYASRMRVALGITKTQLLAWSSELQRLITTKELECAGTEQETFKREEKLINHQNCVISELVALNQDLSKRVEALEKRVASQKAGDTCRISDAVPSSDLNPTKGGKSCGSKAHPKSPAAVWYEWYAKTPRMWDECANRQQKSTYKQITNYLKFFLAKGFVLDPSSSNYSSQVFRVGKEAEAALIDFFLVHNIKSRNGSSVLKQLRKLHREGKLNHLIDAHASRVKIGAVEDPAPDKFKEFFTRS